VIVVTPNLAVKTFAELINYAKANPGKLNFASAGIGTAPHLAGEMIKLRTGIDMAHVPYRGAGPAITDLLGGQIQVMFVTTPLGLAHIQAGRLRPLAYTNAKRAAFLPDVPTMEEAGASGVTQTQWLGVFGPPGLAEPVRQKLSAAVVEIVADADTQTKLRNIGFEPIGTDYVAFDAFFRAEVKRWGDFVRENGLMEK